MIQSLYTAASGMMVQQLNMDTLSNNIANMNTPGYKSQKLNFTDQLYTAMVKPEGSDAVNLNLGHGAKSSTTTRDFSKGDITNTGNALDTAIDGDGFFKVLSRTGQVSYTRDGSFDTTLVRDNAGNEYSMLVTSAGDSVLGKDGQPIIFQSQYYVNGNTIPFDSNKVNIKEDGTITVSGQNGIETQPIAVLDVVNFANPQQLNSVGDNLYQSYGNGLEGAETESTGYKIKQGAIESSNVKLVNELTRLITAQRAYEISSKAVQTSDQMQSEANNMRA